MLHTVCVLFVAISPQLVDPGSARSLPPIVLRFVTTCFRRVPGRGSGKGKQHTPSARIVDVGHGKPSSTHVCPRMLVMDARLLSCESFSRVCVRLLWLSHYICRFTVMQRLAWKEWQFVPFFGGSTYLCSFEFPVNLAVQMTRLCS